MDVKIRLHPAKIHLEFPGVPPARVRTIALAPVHCENPACSSKCPAVNLGCMVEGGVVSFRYPPDKARELAFDILAIADELDPEGSPGRRAS